MGDLKLWRWSGDGVEFKEILVSSLDRTGGFYKVERILENLGYSKSSFGLRSDIIDHISAVRDGEIVSVTNVEFPEGIIKARVREGGVEISSLSSKGVSDILYFLDGDDKNSASFLTFNAKASRWAEILGQYTGLGIVRKVH